ncbi:MAG: ATPase [Culturomica sp.]|jgi:Trk-type K+ transport system membrane component|nr:ATPase [Culturomica sp.]
MRDAESRYRQELLIRKIKQVADVSANVVFFLGSLATIALLVCEFGFSTTPVFEPQIEKGYDVMLWIFLIAKISRIVIDPKGFRREKAFWADFSLLVVFILIFAGHFFEAELPPVPQKIIRTGTYIVLSIVSFIQLSKQTVYLLQRHLKPEVMFITGFLFVIFLGSLLLILPRTHYGNLDFMDALFTSASAVCVNGLSVVDISTSFTFTGQVIILGLIQIGGLGIMTFTSFLALSFFRRISFSDEVSLKNILNENSLSDIFRTLISICLITFTIESLGTVVVYRQIAGIPEEAIPGKLFFSVFHSVSSFCNAGFSLLPENMYSPVLRELHGLQYTTGILIVLGGFGFPILFNAGKTLGHYLRNFYYRLTGATANISRQVHLLHLSSRIVLISTGILIVSGTVLFWLFEQNGALRGLSASDSLAVSFFCSVTPRSGGFNCVDTTALGNPAFILTLILMWIGASPMSTGGGIKTTTLAVAANNILSVIRGKEEVEILKRRIPIDTIRKANAIIGLFLVWIIGCTLVLSITEPGQHIASLLFEAVSATCTAGLSMNVTPSLSLAGKIVVCITLFAGRVGILTLLSRLVRREKGKLYAYPEEQVIL